MPDPGFTRPDLYSIPTAAGQAEYGETARGGLTANGHPPIGDYPAASLETGIARVIRLSTAAAVLAVAGIAAYVSYWHTCAVVRAHGETGITARLEPVPKTCVTWADTLQITVGSVPRSGAGRAALGPSGGAMIFGLWA